MPPRKSNVSAVSATTDAEAGTPSKEKGGDKDGINIEDLSLPRTMVQRLAKGVLPPNTQIHKDAITAMSKGATVFVNYLSQAANQTTLTTSRKTIPPSAVLDALHELEFQDFVPRVEAELKKFNEVQTGKRNEYRRKVREKGGPTPGETQGAVNGLVEEGGGEGERAAKRVRREEGDAPVQQQGGEESFHTAAEEAGGEDDGEGGVDAVVDDAPEEDGGEEEGGDGEEDGEEEGSEEDEGEGEEGEEGIDVEDMDQRILALAEEVSGESGDSGGSGEDDEEEGSE